MKFDEEFTNVEAKLQRYKPNSSRLFGDNILFARYWITIGKQETYIKSMIYKNLKPFFVEIGDNIVYEEVNRIYQIAEHKGPLKSSTVYFSKPELDAIHSFKRKNIELLLFVMFTAYKVEEDTKFEANCNELFKYAMISTRDYEYRNRILYEINKTGLLDVGIYRHKFKYFVTDTTVNLYDPDEIVMEINNFKNLAFYYCEYFNLDYGSVKYFRCANCGCIDKKLSNRSKYCRECSKLIFGK